MAKKYSTDPTSKDNGGVLASVTKGQEDPGLDKAVFAAKKGALHGPVKTPFGYYVFQVSGVTPAVQQTVGQATPSIKQILAVPGPADEAQQVRDRLPEEVDQEDRLPQGLRDLGLQELQGAEDDARRPPARPARPSPQRLPRPARWQLDGFRPLGARPSRGWTS